MSQVRPADVAQLALAKRQPATLQIEKGVPMPKANPRDVVKNTLILMQPGDSFKAEGSSLSNIYKWAQKLRIKLRTKRLFGEARMPGSTYRIWRIS